MFEFKFVIKFNVNNFNKMQIHLLTHIGLLLYKDYLIKHIYTTFEKDLFIYLFILKKIFLVYIIKWQQLLMLQQL
jgi:hypothetical protein